MTGTIKRVTQWYNLRIPLFDSPGWGREMERNFSIIDAAIFLATGLGGITGTWANGTAYVEGDRVVDETDSTVWECDVAHTSATSGTFAADRATNPTYWRAVTNTFNNRGAWTTATAYNVNDIVNTDYKWAIARTAFTSGASMDDDIAANDLVLLIDLNAAVADAGQNGVGHLHGLTLSNAAGDTANDITVAAGVARDYNNTMSMELASAITKRLDAAWASGNNNGGRLGTLADGTWHVYLIASGTTVDVAFSASADPATVVGELTSAGFTGSTVRRIGSIIRSGGTILGFRQFGDRFLLNFGVTDRSSTAAATDTLVALSVPSGIHVMPLLVALVIANTAISISISFGDGDNATANFSAIRHDDGAVSSAVRQAVTPVVMTNTSQQIRYTQINTTGTPLTNLLQTYGWIDSRGRNFW